MGLASSSEPQLSINKDHLKIAQTIPLQYADLAHNLYKDAIKTAKNLESQITALEASPAAATLENAKTAWKQARRSYSKTEVLRFYAGPIDNAETGGPEGLLNAWPIDESYLDYVKDQPNAGLIQNPKLFPKITKKLLVSMNEKDGEKNISTGYHAVEFLLWGQDFSTESPGSRSYTDFVVSESNPHAKRRVQTLKLLSQLITDHLEPLAKEWDPKEKNNYRSKFLKEPLNEVFRKIFTGITTLSIDEMGGERLTVALEINDQENEQDCFSDYSLEDTKHNQEGILEVLTKTDLLKLIEKENPSLATEIVKATNMPMSLADQAASVGSFDKIISQKSESSKGRKKMRALISALNQQGAVVAKAGKNMGLILNVETESESL